MPKLKNLIWSLALMICLCLLGCGGQPTKETPSPAPAPPRQKKPLLQGLQRSRETCSATEPAAPTETPAKEPSLSQLKQRNPEPNRELKLALLSRPGQAKGTCPRTV